jgi:hypothetical protein
MEDPAAQASQMLEAEMPAEAPADTGEPVDEEEIVVEDNPDDN